VESLEKIVEGLRLTPVPNRDDCAALVGGLSDASSADVAKTWLSETMTKKGIEGVQTIFDKSKGGAFNGLVFVKFVSPDKRNKAMEIFNASKLSMFGKTNFMNPDLPVQQRVARKFLANFKKMLVEWKFTPSSVSYDVARQTLEVEREVVLRVKVDKFTFVTDWVDPKWAQWSNLLQDEQYKNLIKTAQDKLNNSRSQMDKGKGKGDGA